jgi:RimJ/RimL family protein N-acetyltransferase
VPGAWPSEGLTRGHVLLRAWRADELDFFRASYAEPSARRWSPPLPALDDEQKLERLARMVVGGLVGRPTAWVITRAESPDVPLGTMDVRNDFPSPPFSVRDVGYTVLEAARGQGLASTALAMLTDWLLDPAGADVHRVQLDHAVQNQASCRTASRAGLGIEGRRAGFLPLREHPDAPVVRHEVCLHGRVRQL